MACELSDDIEIVGLCDEFPDNTQGSFTQLKVPEVVTIPEQKPDIEQVIQILVEAKITNLRLIETPVGVSEEGQILTGEKLVIEGKIHQKVIYVADVSDGSQPVHSAEFDVPFSTFVVVPKCYIGLIKPGKEDIINVQACIESVFIEQINSREVIKSSMLFINAIFPKATITINNPLDGGEIDQGSVISISGTASAGPLLDKVEVFVAGNLIGGEASMDLTTTIDYSIDWMVDVASPPAEQKIEVKVFNCEGSKVASSEINVTVVAP